MAAPSALVLTCDTCGDVPHRVLRGKVGGKLEIVFEGVVKCSSCGTVRSVVTREPRPVHVPVIVSWLASSERTVLEFGPSETVSVGEALDVGETRVEVTAIESGGARVPAAPAKDVSTIWAKRVDQVRVKFSVNKGNRTVAHDVLAAPDEEFAVGEIVDLGKARAIVHHIRTRHRTMREGAVRADEIVRMYGRVVRERTSR
ncbi:MAG: HVO_0476 family zinc finger protein [Methanobacteriota archaeon]